MLTKTNKIKCDTCGKFIGYSEIASYNAMHHLVTPDAEGTKETFESTCKQCLQIELDKADQKYEAQMAE